MKIKYTFTKLEAEDQLMSHFQQVHSEGTSVQVEVTLNPPGTDEVSLESCNVLSTAVREQNLIAAIKELRACVPMSLLAAKRIVEAIRDGERARYTGS